MFLCVKLYFRCGYFEFWETAVYLSSGGPEQDPGAREQASRLGVGRLIE